MAVAVPIALAAYSIVSGAIKQNKANKQATAQAASRPKLGPSQYDKDALSLAESELSTGQSAKSQQAYQETSDRDFSTSMGSILKSGGSPNDINTLFANKQSGALRYSLLSDNLRLAQIDRLVRAQQMNEERDQQQFQFDQWAPWADRSQAIALSKQDAQNSINQGINVGAQGATGALRTASNNASDANYLRAV